MAEVIYKLGIKKDPNCLYFIDKNGDVCKANWSRGGKKGIPHTVKANKWKTKFLEMKQKLKEKKAKRKTKLEAVESESHE